MKKNKWRGLFRSRRAYGRIQYLLEKTGQDLGLNNERRVVDAYTREAPPESTPSWIQSVRLSTQEEDQCGIDVVFTADVGDIFVQVKGDRMAERKFARWQEKGEVDWRIITLIVFPSHLAHEIRNILTPLLWKEYSRLVLEKKKWREKAPAA